MILQVESSFSPFVLSLMIMNRTSQQSIQGEVATGAAGEEAKDNQCLDIATKSSGDSTCL